MSWKCYPHKRSLGSGVLLKNPNRVKKTTNDWYGVLTLDRDLKKGEEINLVAWNKKVPHGTLISIRISWFKPGWGHDEYREVLIKDEGEID